MGIDGIIFGILPIIAYVMIETKYGMRAGIYAAIVAVVIMMSWLFWKTGEFDEFVLIDSGLIIVLGLLSIRLEDEKYFKIQPTIVSGILAIYTAYFQIFSQPLFVHYIPTMEKLGSPEMTAMAHTPEFRGLMSDISLYSIFVFLVHSGICFMAARYWSNTVCVLCKLSVFPLFMIFAMIAMLTHQWTS